MYCVSNIVFPRRMYICCLKELWALIKEFELDFSVCNSKEMNDIMIASKQQLRVIQLNFLNEFLKLCDTSTRTPAVNINDRGGLFLLFIEPVLGMF